MKIKLCVMCLRVKNAGCSIKKPAQLHSYICANGGGTMTRRSVPSLEMCTG